MRLGIVQGTAWRSWEEHKLRIRTDVLGELKWIQGPVIPVTFMEKLFILTRFLRNPHYKDDKPFLPLRLRKNWLELLCPEQQPRVTRGC